MRNERSIAKPKGPYLESLCSPGGPCLTLWLALWIGSYAILSGVAFAAAEYTLTGVVASKAYFYGALGELTNPPPGVVYASSCDFVYYRKGARWRLDIKYPDPSFPAGLWRKIFPLEQGGFVSVTSFPPDPRSAAHQGNAYVVATTNKYPSNDDSYGAHACWLIFNHREIVEEIGATNGCVPFWRFDPELHDLRVKSHKVAFTEGGVSFRNLGRDARRDGQHRVILENGEIAYAPIASPWDKGFVEADYTASTTYLDVAMGIASAGVLTYWTPCLDKSRPAGFRMLPLTQYRIENKSVDSRPLAESIFVPEWNDPLAVVVDLRTRDHTNRHLTYLSEANHFDSSEVEAQRQRARNQMMRAAAFRDTATPHRTTSVWLWTLIAVASLSAVRFCTRGSAGCD